MPISVFNNTYNLFITYCWDMKAKAHITSHELLKPINIIFTIRTLVSYTDIHIVMSVLQQHTYTLYTHLIHIRVNYITSLYSVLLICIRSNRPLTNNDSFAYWYFIWLTTCAFRSLSVYVNVSKLMSLARHISWAHTI